ncbi:hypothetical protein YC2023_004746 [Brassica napus]
MIWAPRFSPKLKLFMWKILHGALPTGENLQKRGLLANTSKSANLREEFLSAVGHDLQSHPCGARMGTSTINKRLSSYPNPNRIANPRPTPPQLRSLATQTVPGNPLLGIQA